MKKNDIWEALREQKEDNKASAVGALGAQYIQNLARDPYEKDPAFSGSKGQSV